MSEKKFLSTVQLIASLRSAVRNFGATYGAEKDWKTVLIGLKALLAEFETNNPFPSTNPKSWDAAEHLSLANYRRIGEEVLAKQKARKR